MAAGDKVLCISFNQDQGCFACGTSSGFRVYNCDPFKETFCRGFTGNGGIGIVEMLFRCNILAIVGGGPAPKYPPNKVMIWDDHQGKAIGELSFRSEVRAVRLRRDRIIVALEHKVLVYNFADLKLMHQIETLSNTRGLVAISAAPDSIVLACPGLHTGQVRIEQYDRKQTRFISAHTSGLSCLALSLDGKRLATTSDKGTLIRVWGTTDGQLLQELRRGSEQATIYCLTLSQHCEWLAVCSDKGTVHVFACSPAVRTGGGDGSGAAGAGGGGVPGGGGPGVVAAAANDGAAGCAVGVRSNPTSMFGLVKGLVPLPKYFASEWSFAQFRIAQPQQPAGTLLGKPLQQAMGGGGTSAAIEPERCIVGFAPTAPHTLVVVTMGGMYYKVVFDPAKGGACTQEVSGSYLTAAQ